jgi:hypothetical protein
MSNDKKDVRDVKDINYKKEWYAKNKERVALYNKKYYAELAGKDGVEIGVNNNNDKDDQIIIKISRTKLYELLKKNKGVAHEGGSHKKKSRKSSRKGSRHRDREHRRHSRHDKHRGGASDRRRKEERHRRHSRRRSREERDRRGSRKGSR